MQGGGNNFKSEEGDRGEYSYSSIEREDYEGYRLVGVRFQGVDWDVHEKAILKKSRFEHISIVKSIYRLY